MRHRTPRDLAGDRQHVYAGWRALDDELKELARFVDAAAGAQATDEIKEQLDEARENVDRLVREKRKEMKRREEVERQRDSLQERLEEINKFDESDLAKRIEALWKPDEEEKRAAAILSGSVSAPPAKRARGLAD